MPIWLRNFTKNQLIKDFQEKDKAIKKAQNQGENSTSANVGDPMPDHMKHIFKQAEKKSNYTTKKAKK